MSVAAERGRTSRCSWEEAIRILREQPEHRQLIHDSYLEADILENCRRFAASEEFVAVLALVRPFAPAGSQLLDLAAGNGIAAYAFSLAGYKVTAVEPDPSDTVGRGAIELVNRQAPLPTAIDVVEAWGEHLPCPSNTFRVVYVRQGLHHARDLSALVREAFRVLAPGGLFIGAREHVVDSRQDLETWLATQPDHLLYGGENAFHHEEYLQAIRAAGGHLLQDIAPYDSIINIYPRTQGSVDAELLGSRKGRLLSTFLPQRLVLRLARAVARRIDHSPGRLHTFVASKPQAGRASIE